MTRYAKYIKFLRFLLPFWKKEILAFSLTGVVMLLGLVNPYITKRIIDDAYRNRNLKLFIILIAVGGAIFLISSIIGGLTEYLNRYIRLKINFNLSRRLFKKMQSLPYGYFQDGSTGENLFRLNYDIDIITQFVTETIPKLAAALLKSLLIVAIVFYLNWRMALFSLMLTPILLLPYYFIRRIRKVIEDFRTVSQAIFKELHEALTHIHLIKAFGKERYQSRRYVRRLTEKIRVALKNSRLEIAGSFVNNATNRLIFAMVTLYGGYILIKGDLTLGSLSAIAMYFSQLTALQNEFLQSFQSFSYGYVSCERLEMILDAAGPKLLEDSNAKEAEFRHSAIEFRNVSFGYKTDMPVLRNLSFAIENGSCVALVGHSGCGKTTLTNLILRLYDLDQGQIFIGGYDSKFLKAKSLYAQIGVVLQEPYLWNDTIKNNINYGRREADFDEIKEAAQAACLDDFIYCLGQGFDTVIGENACKISEGQKQRIAIARALIKRPKILILDEALSSVDAQLEARIIDNIKEQLKGVTLIVISHRFSAIKRMDLVYFFCGPDSVAIGTHDELIKNNSRYQQYLAHQLNKN